MSGRQHRFSAAVLVAVSSFGGLGLVGCGSGAANLLPSVSQPAVGVPSGPVLGYVFSPTDGTLRAMMGVRGSSQLSTSIVPAGVYVAGEASTASHTGLLVDATGTLFAFNLPLSQPLHMVDGLPPHVQISFSASGRTAIAYAAGGSSIALISGLPSSPQVKTIAVPSGSTSVSAVVSDAGTIALALQGTPARVGILSSGGQFSTLTSVAAVGGMNFLPGSDDLLIADSSANTAAVVRNFSTGASSQALSVAGLNQPVAIAGSQDKRWAVIANGADGNVFRVDLVNGAAATELTCACQPTLLSSLAGGGTFRLNSVYGGPVWTVDLSSASPQLLFVPAITKGAP